VLDPDGGPVQACRVAAAQRQRHQLIDPAAALHEEVGARVRQLVELAVGFVGGKRVERLLRAARLGVMLHDHLRVTEQGGVFAVVAQRIGGHLVPAHRSIGDRPTVDGGLRDWRARGERRRHRRGRGARDCDGRAASAVLETGRSLPIAALRPIAIATRRRGTLPPAARLPPAPRASAARSHRRRRAVRHGARPAAARPAPAAPASAR
jgi:hypothetical protein